MKKDEFVLQGDNCRAQICGKNAYKSTDFMMESKRQSYKLRNWFWLLSAEK